MVVLLAEKEEIAAVITNDDEWLMVRTDEITRLRSPILR